MEQPFHIYGSTNGGSTDGDRLLVRRPIVLARIPHVGAQVGTHVGTVTESDPVGPAAPVPTVELQPGPPSQGTRFYVDSQHTSAPSAEPEAHQQPEPHWQPELQSESQSQAERQSRTPGHRRSHRAHSQHRPPESPTAGNPHPSVATGLSRLHEEVASYAGLIVTMVLLASGALMYWMIVAPSQVPVADYSNSYETFGSAGTDILKFAPPTTASTAPHVERQFASPNELSALPETTAESAPELIRLPVQTPAQSDEPEPVFNDASAWAYPATIYPHSLDPARLRVTDVTGENRAVSSSKPEVARRAVPPTPTPVNR